MTHRINSLDDLAWFIRIAAAGSLSRASRVLSVPKSTLSLRLCRLEEAMGVSLAQRSARAFRLTDAGRNLIDEVAPLLHRLQRASSACVVGEREAHGLVRMVVPAGFEGTNLMDLVADFLRTHPNVRVEMEASNRAVNLHGEDLDFCVRRTPASEASLRGRRVASPQLVLCTHPSDAALLADLHHPEDLVRHPLLIAGSAGAPLRLTHEAHGAVQVHARARLVLNSSLEILRMAKAGLGPALLPGALVRPVIEAGALVQVLPEWSVAPEEFYLVHAVDRHLPPWVSELMDRISAGAMPLPGTLLPIAYVKPG